MKRSSALQNGGQRSLLASCFNLRLEQQMTRGGHDAPASRPRHEELFMVISRRNPMPLCRKVIMYSQGARNVADACRTLRRIRRSVPQALTLERGPRLQNARNLSLNSSMPRSNVLLNDSSSRRIVSLIFDCLRPDFWKDVTHGFRYDVDEFVKERLVKTERAAVTNRTTQNATQDVSATFV